MYGPLLFTGALEDALLALKARLPAGYFQVHLADINRSACHIFIKGCCWLNAVLVHVVCNCLFGGGMARLPAGYFQVRLISAGMHQHRYTSICGMYGPLLFTGALEDALLALKARLSAGYFQVRLKAAGLHKHRYTSIAWPLLGLMQCCCTWRQARLPAGYFQVLDDHWFSCVGMHVVLGPAPHRQSAGMHVHAFM
jgi:hypothetical protein